MNNFANLLESLEIEAPQTKKIDLIEAQLFDVKTAKLNYSVENQNFEFPNQYAIIRNDKPANPFGLVTDRFEPIQPKSLFTCVTEGLLNNNIDATNLDYIESFGGAKIRFRVPLKKISFINLRGMEDETELFLNFETGFDGKTSQKIFIDCYRMICANGMRATKTEAIATYRNTSNNIGRLQLLIEKSLPILKDTTKIEELYKALDKKVITEEMRNEFIKQTLILNGSKFDKETQSFGDKTNKIIEYIQSDIEKEIQDSGATMFALVNGITRYNQHTAKTSKYTRDEHINYGTGNKMNSSALEIAEKFLAY